jgi:nucleoside-diphosphate-sugar epimerase
VADLPAFAAAARGCEVIFHAAALITQRGGWEAFLTTNVEGTRNAVAAARDAGARLLQVSSVAVYGPTARYQAGDGGADEHTPFEPLPARMWYARSKRDSEQVVLDAHRRGTVWATAIRPDVLYGRRDRQFVPRLARLCAAGVVPLPGGGTTTLAVVHAANVADAALRAVTHDAAGGQAYNVANDHDVTVAEFFRLAGEGLGRRVRVVPVPAGLARGGMALGQLALRLVGAGGLATMVGSSVDFATRDNPFSSERARRELGWDPRVRPEQGVPDAFRWVRERKEEVRTPEPGSRAA